MIGYTNQRYLHDAQYKALVDTLLAAMVQMRLTPGEMRDAAFMAACKFEMEYRKPWQQEEATK